MRRSMFSRSSMMALTLLGMLAQTGWTYAALADDSSNPAPVPVIGGNGNGTTTPVPVIGGNGNGTTTPVPVIGGNGNGTTTPVPMPMPMPVPPPGAPVPMPMPAPGAAMPGAPMPTAAGPGASMANAATPIVRSVTTGEQFDIRLDANATTGYSWAIDTLNSRGLEKLTPRGEKYEMAGQNSQLAGAPGTQIFQFTANTPGDVLIQLVYRRPWMPNEYERVTQARITIR